MSPASPVLTRMPSCSNVPDASALWSGSTYDFPIVVGRNVDIHDESNSYGNGRGAPALFLLVSSAALDLSLVDY